MKNLLIFYYLAGVIFWLAASNSVQAEDFLLYDFSAGGEEWEIEDDGVMGGLSRGNFTVNEIGHGVFSGEVSLENNGGFSSVQYYFDDLDVSNHRTVCLHLRGDGNRYRFLVESKKRARNYYAASFSTSGDWETVEIPFAEFEPFRRGDRLDLPNFPGQTLAQIRIMIANDRAESFQLEVERIWLK